MANWMTSSEWERSHPWLAGLLNGTIIGIAFYFGYSFTSDSEMALQVALVAGVLVAIVRGSLLSRERKKETQ